MIWTLLTQVCTQRPPGRQWRNLQEIRLLSRRGDAVSGDPSESDKVDARWA